ncbi:MAG: toll/interleukin-1 receptor domain-containing protein [Planctomycetota bacterium]
MQSAFAFISYSTKDLVWARRVQEMFTPLGLDAYVAERQWPIGQPPSAIIDIIRQIPMVVLVWSKAASESEWVKHEVGAAHGADVPIVVFNLEPSVQLPEPIRGPKYADALQDPFAALAAVQGAVCARYRQMLDEAQAQAAALQEQRRRAKEAESNKIGAALLIGGLGGLFLAGLPKK